MLQNFECGGSDAALDRESKLRRRQETRADPVRQEIVGKSNLSIVIAFHSHPALAG
jgi:hypothetical protein